MKVVLINLDRSPDRLRKMTGQAGRLGLNMMRFAAIDGRKMDQSGFENSVLTPGEMGCALSHIGAWRGFLEGHDSHVLIFEDDIIISPDLCLLISNTAWIPADADIVKVDTSSSRVGISRDCIPMSANRTLSRLMTSHMGCAGYILTRRTAENLMHRIEKLCEPIDITMFGDAAVQELMIYQVSPALVQQRMYHDAKDKRTVFEAGSITAELEMKNAKLKEPRPHGLRLIWREIRRPFKRMYEKCKPMTALKVRSRNVKFGAIPFS